VPYEALTLFLGGDVMTGRGLDQILPHPGSPTLRERSVRDARDYVELAESANGAVPRPAGFDWPWGELLGTLDELAPDVRLVNLETAVTSRGKHEAGKGIHYRMHPANAGCLTAAGLDVCALANNHVLDFGPEGLVDTVDSVGRAGIHSVGAGPDEDAAWTPIRLEVGHGTRVLVWSVAAASSGVPPDWSAGPDRPGVAYLAGLTDETAEGLAARARAAARPGDLVIVSVHWGSNWGYEVSAEQVRFAHRLVEGGVHVVHGHSSHHPRPVEVYRDRLILYGCGDLIDDYEGISGYEAYRPELRLAYLPTLDRDGGRLLDLRMIPLRVRRMRLQRAAPREAEWLAATLTRTARPYGCTARPEGGLLRLSWA
jgi:poly-gamma-glutamate capsule biosynthesis protein CapA/YwtB (metallophosphatase superfamily)